MEIKWHGETCFSIKGKDAQVVINPYKGAEGLKADMVIMAGSKKFDASAVDGVIKIPGGEPVMPRVFDWPGEYEVEGIWAMAIPYEDSMIFAVAVDDVRICHLDHLDTKLTDEITEMIGEIDILLVPVSDTEFTSKKAQAAIEMIEPRVVIPMIGPFKSFLKEVGKGAAEEEKSYRLQSRAGLPKDKTEFVVLSAA